MKLNLIRKIITKLKKEIQKIRDNSRQGCSENIFLSLGKKLITQGIELKSALETTIK